MPYQISEQRGINNTLIIGSGGGSDVLYALAAGSKKVTAVELNPSVVSVVRKFGNLTGNIYDRDDVDLFIDDGRRFLSSSPLKFDIIMIRMVDSWAAQLAGGYALSENYIYTVEAFRQYLQHLDQDHGLLVMVRWNIELPRIIPLVIEALRQEEPGKKSEDISRQLVVIEQCQKLCDKKAYPIIVIAKNSPFNSFEIKTMENNVVKNNATFIAKAGEYVMPPYDKFLSSKNSLENPATKENSQTNNNPSSKSPNWQRFSSQLKLPTDDSPFYFAKETVPRQMIILLETILILSAALAAILIYYSRINRMQKNSHLRFHILFVIFIGLGFIFLEITFIQRFLLLLGTPIMALSVILFSILLSTGIGSYLSGRLFSKNPYKAITVSILILAAIVFSYYGFLQGIIYSSIVLELSQRILLTFALLFPVGIVMGFQFPSIIRIAYSSSFFQRTDKGEQFNRDKNTIITLLWGVNVIASVVGTVITVISSMTVGFGNNLLIAAGLYLAALCTVALVKRRENLPDVRVNV